MAYLQRNAVLYIQKTRESSYNTPETTGSNYLRAVTDNNVVFIPNPEKRNDLGRAGSEFATGQCNTYWQPTAIAVAGEVDFNSVMARLWLRAVGGTITDATVVTAAAFSHTAPMLPGSSGLQLPSFNALADIPGSGADYLYTGLVVDRARLSQDGAGVAQCSFDLIGSGKHRSPGNVSSLPSASSFTCVKPYAYLSYNNGGAIDLASGTCRVKSWFVELSNNHSPQNDRCIGDSSQDYGDYTASGGASDAAYLGKLEHGDRTVTAEIVLELDSSLDEMNDMAENVSLTNVVFGARGAVLDAGGPTYESLKLTMATAQFQTIRQTEVNGKACITLAFLPTTTGTSVLSCEVVNATTATNFK